MKRLKERKLLKRQWGRKETKRENNEGIKKGRIKMGRMKERK